MPVYPTLQKLSRQPNAWLLFALMSLVFLFPFLEHDRVGRAAIAAFDLVILVLALRAARSSGAETRLGYVLALPAMALHVAASYWGGHALIVASFAAQAIFHAFVVVCLLRYILRDEVMTLDELFAAAALYVLLAFVFAYLYGLSELLAPGAFLVNAAANPDGATSWWELLYFSFTTLTSVGYGDITPINDHVRSLVIIEQTLGVLYFALVVSRLVSLQARRRPTNDDTRP